MQNKHIIKNLVIVGGARVNVIISQFQTPLHMCVINNDIEGCRFLLSKGAKTRFTKGRFLVDVHLDVNEIGTPEMKLFFSKYKLQQRNKNKNSASKRTSKKRQAIKKLSKDYEFVCSEMQDESNRQLVMSLASKLHFSRNNIKSKSKKELCDMFLKKLGVLSISPEIS